MWHSCMMLCFPYDDLFMLFILLKWRDTKTWKVFFCFLWWTLQILGYLCITDVWWFAYIISWRNTVIKAPIFFFYWWFTWNILGYSWGISMWWFHDVICWRSFSAKAQKIIFCLSDYQLWRFWGTDTTFMHDDLPTLLAKG